MSQFSKPLCPPERHEALRNLTLIEQAIADLKSEIASLPELDGRIQALVTQLVEKARHRNRLIKQTTGLNIPICIELFFA